MIFEVAPANVMAVAGAWVCRVEVDPTDWEEASQGERLEFGQRLLKRYADSQGNSAVDLVEVMGEGRVLRSVELHVPPRRSGPDGPDRQEPRYARGRP